MTIADLIANLSVNTEPEVAFGPNPTSPLIITKKMLQSIENGTLDGSRLAGYKGDIFWTTAAMMWMKQNDCL